MLGTMEASFSITAHLAPSGSPRGCAQTSADPDWGVRPLRISADFTQSRRLEAAEGATGFSKRSAAP